MKRYTQTVKQCYTKGHKQEQTVTLRCVADNPARARAIFEERVKPWKKLGVEVKFIGEPTEAPKKA